MVEQQTYESVLNWLSRADAARVALEDDEPGYVFDEVHEEYERAVNEARSLITGKNVTMDDLFQFALEYQGLIEQTFGHLFLVMLIEYAYDREHGVM